MGEENLYAGSKASYGLSPSYGISETYGESFFGREYRQPTGSFAMTTDPRSANILKEVSAKLNTGAKSVEITSLQPNLFESIPQQHLEEVNRLRKLAGMELTLHGPLIEASGLSKEGVDESRRRQSEVQMAQVMERANKLDPKGNVVVTFHTTSGLPEMVSRNLVEEGGEKKEKVSEMYIISERDGGINILKPKPDYLEQGGKTIDPYKELEKFNEKQWEEQLSHVSHYAHIGRSEIFHALKTPAEEKAKETGGPGILDLYERYNTKQTKKDLEGMEPEIRREFEERINKLNYGEIYVRDAYGKLQNTFNQVWEFAKKNNNKEDLATLEKIRDDITKAKENFKDKKGLPDFAESVVNGISMLNNLKQVPQLFVPLQDFIVDKSSETFSNVALNTYQKFKENSPIISLENPPIGMGIGRAEDLKNLIDESRRKLSEKLIREERMSKEEAKKEAEKLIGATWDVGHINMMKQYGYKDEDIVKETEKIAKYVNKIHLSDNFGMEHTEIPMGMGNVPMPEHLKELKKAHGNKLEKIKKVIEAGDWYQHFQVSPFQKTLQTFGSPIYGMEMASYWNQTPKMNASYFSGYGMMLPEQHFSMYGAGFSSLPVELGGQMSGKSRMTGNPME